MKSSNTKSTAMELMQSLDSKTFPNSSKLQKNKKAKSFLAANIEDKVEDLESYKRRAASQKMDSNFKQDCYKNTLEDNVPPNSPVSDDTYTDECWEHFSGIFFEMFPSVAKMEDFRPQTCGNFMSSSLDMKKEREWRVSREDLRKVRLQKEEQITPCRDQDTFELGNCTNERQLLANRRHSKKQLVLPKKPNNPAIDSNKRPKFEENSIAKRATYEKVHLPFTDDNTLSVWFAKTPYIKQTVPASVFKPKANTSDLIKLNNESLPSVHKDDMKDCLITSASMLNIKEAKKNVYKPALVNIETDKLFVVRNRSMNSKGSLSKSTPKLESILRDDKKLLTQDQQGKKVTFSSLEKQYDTLQIKNVNKFRDDNKGRGNPSAGRMSTQHFRFPLSAKRDSFERFKPRHKIFTSKPIAMEGKITYDRNDYDVWSRTKTHI